MAASWLAQAEALFAPVRRKPEHRIAPPWIAAVHERRSLFETQGLPFIGGGNVASRKASERRLKELEALGVIQIGRLNSRRLAVRLTPEADTVFRIRTGAYAIHEPEVWKLLVRIGKLTREGRSQGGFVLERDLLGRCYSDLQSDDLVGLENTLLPALVGGLVDSHHDTVGRVGYMLTDAGVAAIEKRKPRKPRKSIAFNPELSAVHDREFLRTLRERESWEPDHKNHIVVPLSAGLWPACEQCHTEDEELTHG